MRRMPRLFASALLATGCAVGVVPALSAAPAAASAAQVDSVRLNGFEADLVADINSARRNAGLRPLVVVPGATDVARRWSWQMAGDTHLWHNPSIVSDIEHAGSSLWTMVSENVGYGDAQQPDMSEPVGELHTAGVGSADHDVARRVGACPAGRS